MDCLPMSKVPAESARSMHRRKPAPRKRNMPKPGSGRLLAKCSVSVGLLLAGTAGAQETALRPYKIAGDAITQSLTGTKGDVARGRAIVVNRQVGLCLLCHSGPFPEERLQRNLAPDLTGTGARWSEGQLRLRMVDASKLNPTTIMPPYYRVQDLTN